MTMKLVKDRGVTVNESPPDYQRFFASPGFIHYTGMLNPPRPGVEDCIQMLEQSYYKPGTDRNHLFIMRVLEWQDMLWVIVSIPIGEKAHMERVAQVNGLRVANGVPTMLSGDGVHRFPVSNDRVFTLENISGHPVYTNQGDDDVV